MSQDAMLGRFYAICNCCSCCCGAMNAWNNGTPILPSSGCGVCISQYPQEAISLLRDPVKGEPLEIQKLIARAAEIAFDSMEPS